MYFSHLYSFMLLNKTENSISIAADVEASALVTQALAPQECSIQQR